jgi:hypothetical protein
MGYDFERRTGRVQLAPENCCDMEACVALFEGIDRNVTRIELFAGDILDIVYFKTDYEEWLVREPECPASPG